MNNKEQAHRAVRLAIKHLGHGMLVSSAKVCLQDAVSLLEHEEWDHAWRRALDSIAYSVGFLHADYQREGDELHRRPTIRAIPKVGPENADA